MPEFEALRDQGPRFKKSYSGKPDFYLEQFEANVIKHGGQVHWAQDAAEARQIVLDICRAVDAKSVTKGKSMISEEID